MIINKPERQITLADWITDFSTLISSAWGLPVERTIALADSLLEALVDSDLVLHVRPDALPVPSRLKRNLIGEAMLDKLVNAEALSEAVNRVGGSASGIKISCEALATLFLDQIRATYALPPLVAIQVHQAVTQVLHDYELDSQPLIAIPKVFERELIVRPQNR